MPYVDKTQSGAALIVSLVILILITLIGLTAIRTSAMEEKMAANTMDQEIAFQAAETALRTAESWLITLTKEPEQSTNGSSNVWSPDAMDPNANNALNWWQERDSAWWEANAVQIPNVISFESSAGNRTIVSPHYVIEYQQFIDDDLLVGTGGGPSAGKIFYRITARGTGGSANSRVLLQTTLAKRF